MDSFVIFNVYLLYGLVFFTIGCVISFRNFKFSRLAIASALPALALFGYTHALHEWSDLYLVMADPALHQQWWVEIGIIRVAKLLLSFLALLWFAWQMLEILAAPHRRWITYLVPGLVGIYLLATAVHWSIFPVEQSLHLSVHLTRWIFGLAAGGLAGLAMILYARQLARGHHQGAQAFAYAGLALITYAVSAGLLESHWGIWVPMIRTLCAFALLMSLLQALKLFDQEYQDQIEAQQKRILRGEKLRAIGELASGVAHEIKTPLSYATLGCDLLERQLPEADGPHRQVARIRHGLERASHISQQLLHFSRQGDNEIKSVALAPVIHSALELMHHRLKGVELDLALQPDLVVEGDGVKLEEVIINLVSNALDASENLGRIRIEAGQRGSLVRVAVIDWAGGMAPEQLAQATSPFFTTKPQGQGTGLGLPICQQILQQHHGELHLSNGTNGLVAEFTLPRSQARSVS